MKTVTVVGAGLSGSLLSLYLAKQNYKVHVYEKRPDMRQMTLDRGRSINLAISKRGVFALEKIGIADHIMAKSIPMYARMVHDINNNCEKQFYGRNGEEHIDALSRSDLNIDLLNFMDSEKNITSEFNKRIIDINIESGLLTIFDEIKKETYTVPTDVVIATDGGPSIIRQVMTREGVVDFSTDHLSHGYKELLLDTESSKALDKNCLHIWPRNDFMLIALPNINGSFTFTLFLAMEGSENSFEQLKNREQVTAFFKKYFSDIQSIMADLTDQFLSNPVGELITLRGGPWYYKDKILLLGDASHAIVPFFGQGMNCAFEDCTVFDELLREKKNDWENLFFSFYNVRKKNTDAIAQMAIDNFLEMRNHTGKKEFLLHKEIEKELMKRYGSKYVSRYVMVSFTRDPYQLAEITGHLQRDFLKKICQNIVRIEDIDWNLVEAELDVYLLALEKEKAIHGLI